VHFEGALKGLEANLMDKAGNLDRHLRLDTVGIELGKLHLLLK
jgi:hypothetical protein